MIRIMSLLLAVLMLATGCTEVVAVQDNVTSDSSSYIEEVTTEGDEERPARPEDEDGDEERPPRPEDEEGDEERPPRSEDEEGDVKDSGSKYSIDQAISDNAQLTTIAFSGLAFLTGNEGADSFFPPGKVADFFGFQYMRDVDVSGYGHNTTFLTKIASNMLYILNDSQLDLLKTLAEEQADLYEDFGYGRLVMIDAFRAAYEDDFTLNASGVVEQSEYLYGIDGELSLRRAEVFGEIVRSLTTDQLDYINAMSFDDSSTWPEMEEEGLLDKTSMSHLEHVAVMTYASELFSWYAGSVESDIYFCPERHGTYFGGFYMKDYPAMGNPDYFISTSVTGNSGKEFLEILTETQREKITSILEEQRSALDRIVEIRTEVSEAFRTLMTEESVDEDMIMTLLEEYGTLEGEMSLLYATRFAEVGDTLTDSQMEALITLRNQNVYPEGAYLYSQPIEMPTDINSADLLNK